MASIATGQETEVETFTVPQFIHTETPRYPADQARVSGEGIVSITFMVDQEGQAIEPVIVESRGADSFHRAALDALEKSTFEPGRLNGEAIVGSQTIRYEFVMDQETFGASRDFVNAYRKFQEALERGDREEIETALAELEGFGASNHYEYAILSVARFQHARLYGTELEQIDHIRNALSFETEEGDRQFLEPALVQDMRRILLPMQVRNSYFGEALDTYELMVAAGDEEGAASFESTIEAVKAVQADDTEYSMPIVLEETGTQTLKLFKGNFGFLDGQGDLAEVHLRCERNYIAFAVERDISYSVPSAWGDCSLQIIGDAGAEFMLLQH